MNTKLKTLAMSAIGIFVAAFILLADSHNPPRRIDPLRGIVYYKHPRTGELSLYLAYELQANHTYSFQVTTDGVNFSELLRRTPTVYTYESFNIPDPCSGLWPRVIDLGLTQ